MVISLLSVALLGLLSLYAAVRPWGRTGDVLLVLSTAVLLLRVQGVTALGWPLDLASTLWLSVAIAQGLFLGIAFVHRPLVRLAILMQPVFFVLAAVAAVLPSDTLVQGAASPLLKAHIYSAVLAYGVLTLAAFCAFAVFTREAYLKAHARSSFSDRLPTLATADRAQTLLLVVGQVLLGLALLAGAFYQHGQTGVWFEPTVKTVLTSATFALMCVVLAARLWLGARGGRLAQAMLLAYLVMVVGVMGHKVWALIAV
jgi:ABC-type uncharacterized transport system permease subunit